MRFTKPPKTFDEQVKLLKSRGMVVDDPNRAKKYLSHLNYYRLAAYWLPFEETHSPHRFKSGTTFNTVLEHYIFDRELRLLVMDAIERIEVSLRTQWAYYLSHTHGTHAHLEQSLHISNRGKWNYSVNVIKLKNEVRQSSEIFIRHFDQYDEDLPPLWGVCEVMTLGQLSRWYSNLRHRRDRNSIARVYGFDEKILTSFLHHLSIVRNTCAHHARLWNREFTFSWVVPKRTPAGLYDNFNPQNEKRIYNTLVMIACLMDSINPHSWKQRLNNLFISHPEVKSQNMGFPGDWKDRPTLTTNLQTTPGHHRYHIVHPTPGPKVKSGPAPLPRKHTHAVMSSRCQYNTIVQPKPPISKPPLVPMCHMGTSIYCVAVTLGVLV